MRKNMESWSVEKRALIGAMKSVDVDDSGNVLRDADSSLKRDRDVAFAAVNSGVLELLDKSFRDDKDFLHEVAELRRELSQMNYFE